MKVRDERKPGWFWVDNEVLDVFGDELGQNGISVYITMARLSRDGRVSRSLREIATEARMKKDTVSRTMKVVVGTGLVVESKGEKTRTVSTYVLADVKELVLERKQNTHRSVGSTAANQLSHGETDASHGSQNTVVDKKFSPPADATDLSHNCRAGETDLSQNAGPFKDKTKEPKKEENPHSPQGGAMREAVAKVMRECSLSNPRIESVIVRAMEVEHAKSDAIRDCNATAERMIANWQRFSNDAWLMRYQVGPRKFFAEGLWLGQRWPYDQQKLRELRPR